MASVSTSIAQVKLDYCKSWLDKQGSRSFYGQWWTIESNGKVKVFEDKLKTADFRKSKFNIPEANNKIYKTDYAIQKRAIYLHDVAYDAKTKNIIQERREGVDIFLNDQGGLEKLKLGHDVITFKYVNDICYVNSIYRDYPNSRAVSFDIDLCKELETFENSGAIKFNNKTGIAEVEMNKTYCTDLKLNKEIAEKLIKYKVSGFDVSFEKNLGDICKTNDGNRSPLSVATNQYGMCHLQLPEVMADTQIWKNYKPQVRYAVPAKTERKQ